MINLLYKIYFMSSLFNKIDKRDYLGRIAALLIRKCTSYYYRFTTYFYKYGLSENINIKPIIVSLTSFPGRINVAWISIESLLRQTMKPDEIILWLGKEEISGLNELPITLLNQIKRGLKIKFRDDLKPHKKYLYSLKEYPDSVVITVDDDIIFPYDTIECLYNYHKKYPHSVICHGARKIVEAGNYFAPYNTWPNWYANEISSDERYDIMPLGGMGALYPPHSLHTEVCNVELIKRTCLKADDLWLKSMALKNGTKTVLTNKYPRAFINIPDTQITTLMSDNIGNNQNDIQLAALNEALEVHSIYRSLSQ